MGRMNSFTNKSINYLRNIDFNSYSKKLNLTVGIDLTKRSYHGGTSYSSGAIPKWDFDGWMIKSNGKFKSTAINECLIYDTCKEVGLDIAEYYPINILFKDKEDDSVIVEVACLTKIFPGNIVFFNELKRQRTFSGTNDNLIKLIDNYPNEINRIVTMFVIDYIFANEDRHSKNFGLQFMNGIYKFCTIFDNGSSLGFSESDKFLQNIDLNSDKCKIESRTNLDNIKFIGKWVLNKCPFSLNDLEISFDNCIKSYVNYYSRERYSFINFLVKERINNVRKIFSND